MNRREFLQLGMVPAAFVGWDRLETLPRSASVPPELERLYPVQRFVVKLLRGLELDGRLPADPKDRIQVRAPGSSKVQVMTEVEYLRYLEREGRCNWAEQQDKPLEVVLSMGRRAGKTTMASLLALLETRRLLDLYNPQAHYGFPQQSRLNILSVNCDKEAAGIVFDDFTGLVVRDDTRRYITTNTLCHVNFSTPNDLDMGPTLDGRPRSSVRVTFKSSYAKGLRGHRSVMMMLDDVAHFPDGTSYRYRDYRSMVPLSGQVIGMSSPREAGDEFHAAYLEALGSRGSRKLALQIPSWEANPTILLFLEQIQKTEAARHFRSEWGAEFV